MTDDEMRQLKERVIRARALVRRHRDRAKADPFDVRIQAIHAAAAAVTGPFLLGEYDHLRTTDRAAFERERLKAVAADDLRIERVADVEGERQTLARLEAEYTALAVELADNL